MITSAQPQLLDLAEAMRGREWRDELEQALAAARNAGWPWMRTLLESARLLCAEDASPRDLTAAVRADRPVPVDPEHQAAVAAEARAELERIRRESPIMAAEREEAS